MRADRGKSLLVVLAKEPVPGQVKTRLTPALSPAEAADLYRCFILDRLEAVAALSGIDLAISYTPTSARDYFSSLAPGKITLFPQQGRDLGEKLQGVFAFGFAAAYERVVIVDSDSPDLPGTMLSEAFARLADPETGAVFGPCFDGGYYLVGLKGNSPELFDSIPWSRDDVLQQSLEKAAALGLKISLLPCWNDIDTFADLQTFYHTFRPNSSTAGAGHHTFSHLASMANRLTVAAPAPGR